jgi:hypothetical protein
MTAKGHRKAEQLNHWRGLEPGQNPLPHMGVIPYKATGSRYGACGVRIDGNPAFIDAVLSNLKPLLAGEGITTRLELARHAVDGSGIGKELPNAETGAEVCYIRLHQRGHEGAMVEAICAGARERQAARAGLVAQLDAAGA